MINTCASKIIASPVFAKSRRQRALLTYLINQMKDGNSVRIKGYVIASDVFNRNENFDPTSDAIVRVEASRLRQKLRQYYDSYGVDDPIEITLPKGSYAIKVMTRDADVHREGAISKENFSIKTQQSIPKLAIMPFEIGDEIGTPDKLTLEISEKLISALLRLDFIPIIPPKNASRFGHAKYLPHTIAKDLDAAYLLEGVVHKSNNTLKLMARLYSQAEKKYVWHQRFAFSSKDIDNNLTAIVNNVHKFLVDKMSPTNAEHFDLKHSCNPLAQQLVIKGMEAFWKYSPKHLAIAKANFNSALKLEPGYASANAWLSRALTYEYITDKQHAPEKLRQAHQYAEKSYALNGNSAYALSLLGWTNLWLNNHTLAINNGRDAVLLDPNNAEALSFLSMILASTGAGEEAVTYAQRSIALNPYASHVNMFSLGLAYFAARRFQEAQDAFIDGCALNSSCLPSFLYLCLSRAAIDENEKLTNDMDKLLCMISGDKTKLCNSYFVHPMLKDMDFALRRKLGLSDYLN